MPKIEPISIQNLGVYGVIRQASVDDNLIPDGAVSHCLNCHFDRMGAITGRLGQTAMGNVVVSDKSCLGLYNALFEDSSKNCLLSVFSDGTNNDIYSYATGAWVKSLEDDTSGLKTRFATFSDNVIRVNGTDAMKCFDGSSWSTSGDPLNVDDIASTPTAHIAVYKSRVYTSGNSDYPDRLFFSSIIDTSGNITWTPGTDYVDINPSDGENISALYRFSLELLIFKPNYIYRFKTSGVDPDPLIKIGTRSQESIVEGKKGVYFHHDTGFYRYSGGYPEEISRPISDWVNNISVANYDDIVGWNDNDHIKFSVGDVVINGITYGNIVLRYTESSEIWTIYSYNTQITAACSYKTSADLTRIVGDESGYVLIDDYGYTDNGTAISYEVETKWNSFGNITENKKISSIVSIGEKPQGSELMYLSDDKEKWESIGQMTDFLNYHRNLNIEGHRIKFRISGISSYEPFVFLGLHLVEGLTEGVIPE